MAFDPTKPPAGSLVSSAELREPLASLRALIDERATAAVRGGRVGEALDRRPGKRIARQSGLSHIPAPAGGEVAEWFNAHAWKA